MTVEFLDPRADHDDDGTWVDPPEDRRRARLIGGVDVVLSLAGAGLLVVASFGTVFREHGGSPENYSTFRVTGWGKIEAEDHLLGGHTARVGILFCVAAGLVVLGLAARLLASRARPLGIASGVAAVGVAAATVTHAVLDVLAARENLDTSRAGIDSSDGPLPRPPSIDLGSFVWLGAAGAVCVLLAVIGPAAVRRRSPEPPAPPTADVAVGPTDAAEDDLLR